MKIVLETPRLLLREMTLADLDFVAEMLAHPEVMRFYPKLYARDEAQAWIERQLVRYLQHRHGLWLVLDKSSLSPIGQVGLLMQEVDGQLEPEIGYLIHRPFWRQGFATEAAVAVKQFALEERGCSYVISLIRPENEPSQGVARKLGMQPVRETLFKEIRHLVFRVESGSEQLSMRKESAK